MLWYDVRHPLREKTPRKGVREVKAVGESESSTWTLSCVLIVSLTTLSGGGAGSIHADGLPAAPYIKYLVKLRWSI